MVEENKKSVLLINIYYGTGGNSGLYLHEILECLNNKGYHTVNFVNSKYLFLETQKNCEIIATMLKYSNFIEKKIPCLPRIFIKIISFLNLFFDYLYILNYIKKNISGVDCIIVNYSLVDRLKITLNFLKRIKMIPNVTVLLTPHETQSFHVDKIQQLFSVKLKVFFEIPDGFVIHNNSSRKQLMDFGINESQKIYCHPFPLMDLQKISRATSPPSSNEAKISFLFIGFLRIEKGVDLLIHVWKKIGNKYNNVHLIIAGEAPLGLKYNFDELHNFTFINKFVDDDLYIKLIEESHYVLLPYRQCTNSGVLSTVFSLGRPVLCSDIDTFKNFKFINSEYLFKSGNEDSLYDLFEYIIHNHQTVYQNYINTILKEKKIYHENFKMQVIETYNKIIKDNCPREITEKQNNMADD